MIHHLSNHLLKILAQSLFKVILSSIFLSSISFSSNFKFAKYAGDFLSIGVGGRALGMGGAFTSVANDVTAGYWNPAGLAEMSNAQLILMHDERFAGIINYDYIGVALKPVNFYSLGLSIIKIGVDDIPFTGNAFIDNNNNGIFDPDVDRLDPDKFYFVSSSDWVAIVSFARGFDEKISIGGNVKFIYRKIDKNTGIGVGFDFAIKYRVKDFSIGAVLRDATSTLISWNTGRNELVTPSIISGISGEFEILWGRFTPAVDLILRFEGRNKTAFLGTRFISVDFNFGGEYTLKDIIAIRSGFTENKEFTLGAGIKLNRLDIDYSFAKFNSELGNTHRVSVKFLFNK